MPRVCAGQRRGGGRGADLREEALSPQRAASDSPGCLTTPLDPVRTRRGRGPPKPPRRCASVRALGSVGLAAHWTPCVGAQLGTPRAWLSAAAASPLPWAPRFPPRPGGADLPRPGFLRTTGRDEELSVGSEECPSRPISLSPGPS